MGVADLLQVALGVLSLATLAGLGFTYGRVQGLEKRATSAEAEAADLRQRLDDRDETIEELKSTHLKKIQEQDAEILALGRVVTGEAYLVALTNLLEVHEGNSIKSHADILAALREIRELLLTPRRASDPGA